MNFSQVFVLSAAIAVSACDRQDSAEESVGTLISAAEQGEVEKVSGLLSASSLVDQRDQCEWTALMKAALNGHSRVVTLLLANGADANLTDKGGYSALMLAASNNHVHIVDMLAIAGANVNQVEITNGWTALIWAAKRGHKETVVKLLALGASPQAKDHKGLSALSWALVGQHAKVTQVLQ